MAEQPELTVANVAAWRQWLDENEGVSDGVWLVLAKKGSTAPTTLTYAQALQEALCSGWIDGQTKSKDADTYAIRFTPRRRRSLWSERNVGYVAQLLEEGRMRPRGIAEVDAAKADGRWDRAYAGPATAQVPADLAAALEARPAASAAFEALTSQERFAVLFQLMTASNEAVRERRLAKQLQKLETG